MKNEQTVQLNIHNPNNKDKLKKMLIKLLAESMLANQEKGN